MKTKIDIETWKRKEHFNLFSTFDHPYLTIASTVKFKTLYNHCKKNKISFFIAYMHLSNLATNKIPEFKFRIEGNEVYEYDVIHGSPTIIRDNETFGFAYFKTDNNFSNFYNSSAKEIERVKKLNTLELNTALDNIYYSILPDLFFTQIQHPEIHSSSMSIPKIVFGKMDKSTTDFLMPISVSVHHALADGLHVNKYFNLLQKYIYECNQIIKL